MTIQIEMKETSSPIVHENIENAYTKGDLYCVYSKENNTVHKYPLANIFRVKESYVSSSIKDSQ